MRRLIIDTNFLMIPYEFKVDIFSEFDRICNFQYKLFIFDGTVRELKKIIENQAGKEKKSAQFALKIAKLKNIGAIKAEQKHVDSLILENADENTIVATQDINLKKKLLEKGISVIILRQKKYLEFVKNYNYK